MAACGITQLIQGTQHAELPGLLPLAHQVCFDQVFSLSPCTLLLS